jgi:hypothetical protein
MARYPEQPLTPAQSAEIDRRIVEAITVVMGEGEYSKRCRDIAYVRAVKIKRAPTLRERVADFLTRSVRR